MKHQMRLRWGLAVLVAIAASAWIATPAIAAPCDVDLLDSSQFEWDLGSDGAIGDGEHIPTGRDDAYDTFGELYVSSDDGGSYSEYTNPDSLACAYEDGDREVGFPADTTTVAGLQIARKVFVPAAGLPFARWVDSFTNTTGAPISIRVRWGGNLGSDSDTVITATSSGDALIDAADNWAATGGDADPQLAHAWDTNVLEGRDSVDLVGEFSISSGSESVGD